MTAERIAVVGTGANPDNPTAEGFAMAYRHADAYEDIEGCEMVACADLVPENAAAFAAEYGIPDEHVYQDYVEMLAEADPDVVSVCVPPAFHADIVIGCAREGDLDAIHCEKPMALTWGQARKMAAAAEEEDVQLTFNHQRRFGDVFRAARARVDEGEIGELKRVEFTWGNFYDNGTHSIDLCNYFNDDGTPEWVIAQLDYREADVRFGTHNENQMLAEWRYENGVYGVASTGEGSGLSDGDWHLYGSEGEIVVHLIGGMRVRVRRDGEGWETEEFERSGSWIARGIRDAVMAVREGRAAELRAENALKTTELIFGGYESVRRRSRVDFPLEVDDNPLEALVESGTLTPEPADD